MREAKAAFRLYPYVDRNSPLIDQLSSQDDMFLDSDYEDESDDEEDEFE